MYSRIKNTGVFLCLSVTLCASFFSVSQENSRLWFEQQINKDPQVIRARAQLNASRYQANALNKVIYNPEISAGFEKEGSFNNYSIGLSQTLDAWDKRGANTRLGELRFYAQQQKLLSLLEDKKAAALSALVVWQSAKRSADLAMAQERRLQTLLQELKNKQAAGLNSALDAELIYLNLSQVFKQISEYQIALKGAQLKVLELLPDWTPAHAKPSPFVFNTHEYAFKAEWVLQHPKVQLAKAQWRAQSALASLTRSEAKADPTIALNAGKNGDDNRLGVSVSMPLHVRNNYQDSIKAAYATVNAAEADYQAIYRKQLFLAKSHFERLQVAQEYYQKWQELTDQRLTSSAELLNKRWQAGDINTSEYLMALNQRAQGLFAGVELEQEYKLAQISFSLAMGQLSNVIGAK